MSRSGPGLALSFPTTADGRPILTREDLERYDPRPNRSGGRERYYCPVHGGDHQRSFSLDPATGLYACHTCGAKGRLKDYWPDLQARPGMRPRLSEPLSAEERGRRELEARRCAERERNERLAAAPLPDEAVAFLARLPEMNASLRQPDSPGTAYLRHRGLDPLLAAALGAGYAPATIWPGDHGRKVGRIVFPLADPLTGRVVSAVGRLCMDADASWSERQQALFRRVKQRKLAGCPAGVWPQQCLAAAHAAGQPQVLVEGPTDVIALLQQAHGDGLHILALIGTANILPVHMLRSLPGVVLALDSDGPGAAAARALRADLAIAGVPVQVLPSGWLGAESAKDPGDLAAQASDDPAVAAWYDDAVRHVRAACQRLVMGADTGVLPADDADQWNDDSACRLLSDLYCRCAELAAALPDDVSCPKIALHIEDALDVALEAQDRIALQTAVEACLVTFTQHVTDCWETYRPRNDEE